MIFNVVLVSFAIWWEGVLLTVGDRTEDVPAALAWPARLTWWMLSPIVDRIMPNPAEVV